MAAQLKPGGQFIFEFGGKGCAERVHSSLERQFARRGLAYPRTFYFPTIGEYAPILERAGFRVEYAVLFDRPTEQKTGDGLADWVRMFVKKPFEGLEPALGDEILRAAVEELRPALFRDGKWFVDYVKEDGRMTKLAGGTGVRCTRRRGAEGRAKAVDDYAFIQSTAYVLSLFAGSFLRWERVGIYFKERI